METNTVVLNVERYNELYDLEKATKAGKKLTVENYSGCGFFRAYTYYFTDDEIANNLKKREKELTKEIEKLKEDVLKAQGKIVEPEKQLTLDDIKQMNYWQFRKWKAGK